MIKSNTAGRVADVSDAAVSGAGPNTSFRGGMRTFAVALGATALCAVTAPAEGGLISGPDASHRALALNYLVGGSVVQNTGGGAVALRTYLNGVQQNLSSSLLSDRYVLAPLHGVTRVLDITRPTGIAAGQSLEISIGSNAQTNRGQVVSVARIITFPGASANSQNLPDYCVLELSQAISGVRPVTLADPVFGQNAVITGFGSVAVPNGSPLRDFWARAGYAPVLPLNQMANYSSTYYRETEFDSDLGIALNWNGQNGDSGASVNAINGNFWGIVIGGTSGTIGNQRTDFLFTGPSNPTVYNNLVQYVPSPSSGALLGLAGLVVARRRR